MKVLILSPYPDQIIKTIKFNKDNFIVHNNKIDIAFLLENKIEFIISYGYKFIIGEEIIKLFRNKIINLHISYLPFNRGSYPNLWSHLENSPSGVSIHYIDEGIDTGDILFQKKISFDKHKHSFRSSYEVLRKEIEELFGINWKLLKSKKFNLIKNSKKGNYKSKKEGEEILKLFEDGWETNIYNAIKIYKNYLSKKIIFKK